MDFPTKSLGLNPTEYLGSWYFNFVLILSITGENEGSAETFVMYGRIVF